MSPVVVLGLAFIVMGLLLWLASNSLRTREKEEEFRPRVPQWPEWLPIGDHMSQTIYEGREYQLSLHLTMDNQWRVILTTRTGLGGIRTLSSEDYSTHRAAESDWKRIYQLLPDAFDLPLEELKA